LLSEASCLIAAGCSAWPGAWVCTRG